jgi:hypothetical protein
VTNRKPIRVDVRETDEPLRKNHLLFGRNEWRVHYDDGTSEVVSPWHGLRVWREIVGANYPTTQHDVGEKRKAP